jgi:Flp pilus assembly protein TadG
MQQESQSNGITTMVKKIARKFREEPSGSVAIMFAVSAGAVMMMMGAAVDYSRMITAKSKLQAATDATILSLARQGTLSSQELSTKAAQLLSTHVGNDPNASIVAGPDHRNSGAEMCIDTQTSIAASIMKIVRIDSLQVKATSCAAVSDAFYEIALVLDNSGSMSQAAGNTSKIAAVRSAASKMVDEFAPINGTQIAAFSVVPFAASVNIGPQNYNASFMDRSGKSSIHWKNILIPPASTWKPASRFDIYDKMFNASWFSSGTAWGGCVEERPGAYLTSDAPANPNVGDSLFVPMLAPDEPDVGGNGVNNYLSDTGGNCQSGDMYEQLDKTSGNGSGLTKLCKYNLTTKLSSSAATSSDSPNKSCTTSALHTLSTDFTSVKSKISGMQASGNTNIFSGLMWGWRTISPNTPFAVTNAASVGQQMPLAYNGKTADQRLVKKVVVLMTDGDNTWGSNSYQYVTGTTTNRWGQTQNTYASVNTGVYGPFGYWQDARLGTAPTNDSDAVSQMNTAALQACTAVKAAGVTIYTIAVGNSISSTGQSILKQCATDGSKYLTATTDSQIVASFQTIADSLQTLHLTR